LGCSVGDDDDDDNIKMGQKYERCMLLSGLSGSVLCPGQFADKLRDTIIIRVPKK
jgi:hypothetical protein